MGCRLGLLHWLAGILIVSSPVHSAPSGTLYSIGTPTAKEQAHAELINRARANPTAEGVRLAGLGSGGDAAITNACSYFGVDLTALQAEFVTGSGSGKPTLVVAPPLSINSKLTAAARIQAQDQITWDYQGHQGHDGSWPWDRVDDQGYAWTTIGENASVSASSPLYGHASFNIDWGFASDGMQGPPRGHRSSIHSTNFREIGVGNLTSAETVIPPTNTTAKGPEVVVEDFATAGSTPFITGVVYYDFNGNSFYDPGEGVGGVQVGATGSSYMAVTAVSGGYSIPVPGNGTYPLEFWFPGATSASHTGSAVVSGGLNVKADWSPTAPAPSLSGPVGPVVGVANVYSTGALGGAASYDLHSASITNSPAVETADGGTSGYTLAPGASGYLSADTTGGYSGKSFHFGHSGISSPTLTLTRVFLPGPAAQLSFQSKLALSTSVQIASVQARPSGGSWTTVWSQAGGGSPGETTYSVRSMSLAAFSGVPTEVRFVFSFASGSYFSHSTNPTAGWYVDNIAFTDTAELTAQSVTNFPGPALSFTPPAAGTYRLWTQPRLADPLYLGSPTSPMLAVTAYASGYAAWKATRFPAVTGGPAADHDGDGLANGVEYAFDLNPTVPTPSGVLPPLVLASGSASFNYQEPGGVHGVTYSAEWSDNLSTWTPLADTGAATSHVFHVSTTGRQKVFLRHRIIVDP